MRLETLQPSHGQLHLTPHALACCELVFSGLMCDASRVLRCRLPDVLMLRVIA